MSIFETIIFLRKHITNSFNREKSINSLKKRSINLRLGIGVEIRGITRLTVGENVNIDSKCLIHCGGMEWSNYGGKIIIGDNSYIGPYCVLVGAGEIEIGNNVLISPHVTITSHQHSYQDADKLFREQRVLFEKVVIKDNVWIGSNAVILPGIKLGSNSIIAAGAVVIKDVPANSLVGGVPAKHIKKLFAKEDGYNELTHKRDV